MKYLMHVISVFCVEFCISSVQAQVTPYHLNGSAYKEDCNCYTLTPADFTKSGSVWNIYKIDLNQSFDFKFNVFLGCKDLDGADGIAFVMQAISTSIGNTGAGIGFQGVTPSIGVIIDTWQNTNNNDPAYDHIAIHQNGDIDHSTANNLAGPVTALARSDNIEDCKWHTFRIFWDAGTKTLQADIDGTERVKKTIDLVSAVFNGDPKVFWGFTAATGGSNNHQRVCTSLNPGFVLSPGQVTCYPTPVQLLDSSASFGSILKWYWDFGDGSVDSSHQIPPPHIYPAPGNYPVTLKILGNNGCVSDSFKRNIIIGSKPVAEFTYAPTIACENTPIDFKDLSNVNYGTITSWLWDIDGKPFSTQNPSFTSTASVTIPVQLAVRTIEGCISDIATKSLAINPIPLIDFSVNDICADSAAILTGIELDPLINISQWNWNFGDMKKGNGKTIHHTYTIGGKFDIQLSATAQNGCSSIPVNRSITVYKTTAFAGHDTIAAKNQSIVLQGSGNGLFMWSPATGLSDPTILNPIATLQKDAVYTLTAYTPAGCVNSDTVTIKVYNGPAFYAPNAFTPNGDEKNDRFRCLAVGMASVDYFNVYNRYGQLVYTSNNYQPGWDGTIRGTKQPSGVYVWIVKGKDFAGNIHSKKGTVVLIR
ncbi:MAG: gliding motility-associated C-terminal domain-containing protein [Chitinophagaceae bacterium]|nr:gliding motility-associated C-terminal domain-containing protein [Chitinophagaceae bacterium]